jgi:hypothetical protein
MPSPQRVEAGSERAAPAARQLQPRACETQHEARRPRQVLRGEVAWLRARQAVPRQQHERQARVQRRRQRQRRGESIQQLRAA